MRAVLLKRLKLPTLTATLLISSSACAFAAAWTQEKGEGIFILSSSYYSSDHYYDNADIKHNQPDYTKQEQNLYLEYGLRDWLTLGGSGSFTSAQQASDDSYAIDDSDIFLRARLWQDQGFVLSAEPILKLPSPASRDITPVIGSATPSTGMMLSGAYGFDALGQHHYAAVDSTYFYRFGGPRDQLHLDATLGIGLTSNITLMPQLFITRRMGSGSTGFTQSSSDDYNMTTLRLSGVYAFADNRTFLQLGAYEDVSVRNAGEGKGVVLAVWRKF